MALNLSNLSAYMILNQIEKNEENILTRKKIANLWMKKLTFNGFLNSFHTHEN